MRNYIQRGNGLAWLDDDPMPGTDQPGIGFLFMRWRQMHKKRDRKIEREILERDLRDPEKIRKAVEAFTAFAERSAAAAFKWNEVKK